MLRLQELREEKNISQKDLANAIQTSPTNIYRWENNLNEPSSGFIIKLCNFLDCPADYLLGRSDDFGNISTGNMTSSEEEILRIYNSLSERNKELFMNIVRTFNKQQKDSQIKFNK